MVRCVLEHYMKEKDGGIEKPLKYKTCTFVSILMVKWRLLDSICINYQTQRVA